MSRVAVVFDYPDEGWPSMDYVGEMVLTHVESRHGAEFHPERVCPAFRRRFTHEPVIGRKPWAWNADRLLNRFWDYPRALRRLGGFDLYHLVDHSYSQLVHGLPRGRAIVTCHDLDTFRCLLEPVRDPRPFWFRAMTRRVLNGLSKAAAVACVSEATRRGLLAHRLVPAERLHVVPNGIHPACTSEAYPPADADAAGLLGPACVPELLHVGSTIPRKRIDVLLAVLAEVRRAGHAARLIQVGGALTPEQERQAHLLGVADSVVTLPFLDRATLAAVYRRASLVLLPSDAEGFGLPVLESLACKTPVLVSDLPALREVGGDAVSYLPIGEITAWTDAVLTILNESRDSADARRAAGLTLAAAYSWAKHADRLAEIYRAVLHGRQA
jgi:glycosyltransferase involved in cell wall biosynthesis